GSTWEGGMREPCIMRWPKHIQEGSVCNELATTMDLLPTLSLLTGTAPPQDRIIDGKDIRPLIFSEPDACSPHEVFFYYRQNNLNAVRAGRWKLHLNENLLFDLEADVGESQDRYQDHPDIVEQLRNYADACREDLGEEGIEGKNCRPVGRVENSQPLTSMDWTHPYMKAAYDI
ncbi:MAG: sulfatase-like hydrolase/transferase, partial [Candidatus Latescibacteria bacterium]|nr:sulfatase-like hydrolase/transferase [Candidatus Latescibacterota bacterium]